MEDERSPQREADINGLQWKLMQEQLSTLTRDMATSRQELQGIKNVCARRDAWDTEVSQILQTCQATVETESQARRSLEEEIARAMKAIQAAIEQEKEDRVLLEQSLEKEVNLQLEYVREQQQQIMLESEQGQLSRLESWFDELVRHRLQEVMALGKESDDKPDSLASLQSILTSRMTGAMERLTQDIKSATEEMPELKVYVAQTIEAREELVWKTDLLEKMLIDQKEEFIRDKVQEMELKDQQLKLLNDRIEDLSKETATILSETIDWIRKQPVTEKFLENGEPEAVSIGALDQNGPQLQTAFQNSAPEVIKPDYEQLFQDYNKKAIAELCTRSDRLEERCELLDRRISRFEQEKPNFYDEFKDKKQQGELAARFSNQLQTMEDNMQVELTNIRDQSTAELQSLEAKLRLEKESLSFADLKSLETKLRHEFKDKFDKMKESQSEVQKSHKTLTGILAALEKDFKGLSGVLDQHFGRAKAAIARSPSPAGSPGGSQDGSVKDLGSAATSVKTPGGQAQPIRSPATCSSTSTVTPQSHHDSVRRDKSPDVDPKVESNVARQFSQISQLSLDRKSSASEISHAMLRYTSDGSLPGPLRRNRPASPSSTVTATSNSRSVAAQGSAQVATMADSRAAYVTAMGDGRAVQSMQTAVQSTQPATMSDGRPVQGTQVAGMSDGRGAVLMAGGNADAMQRALSQPSVGVQSLLGPVRSALPVAVPSPIPGNRRTAVSPVPSSPVPGSPMPGSSMTSSAMASVSPSYSLQGGSMTLSIGGASMGGLSVATTAPGGSMNLPSRGR